VLNGDTSNTGAKMALVVQQPATPNFYRDLKASLSLATRANTARLEDWRIIVSPDAPWCALAYAERDPNMLLFFSSTYYTERNPSTLLSRRYGKLYAAPVRRNGRSPAEELQERVPREFFRELPEDVRGNERGGKMITKVERVLEVSITQLKTE
jgi:hypothetical protein